MLSLAVPRSPRPMNHLLTSCCVQLKEWLLLLQQGVFSVSSGAGFTIGLRRNYFILALETVMKMSNGSLLPPKWLEDFASWWETSTNGMVLRKEPGASPGDISSVIQIYLRYGRSIDAARLAAEYLFYYRQRLSEEKLKSSSLNSLSFIVLDSVYAQLELEGSTEALDYLKKLKDLNSNS